MGIFSLTFILTKFGAWISLIASTSFLEQSSVWTAILAADFRDIFFVIRWERTSLHYTMGRGAEYHGGRGGVLDVNA